MTPEAAEKRARAEIESRTTEQLMNDWAITSRINNRYMPTVRGWIMDELEKRDPEAFNKWLNESAADETLREYMLQKACI